MGAPVHDFAQAKGFLAPPGYRRHQPEATLLYRIVAEHYPLFRDQRAAERRPLPRYVKEEFEAYLKCGRLEHGFLRVRCESCHAEKLVAFSCKRRGFCPSCGGRRMTDAAALLVDELLPRVPIRQWVLSLPFALRYLLATRPEVLTRVLGIVYRAISGHLIGKTGLTRASSATGAVTLIQRFGSALNLNIRGRGQLRLLAACGRRGPAASDRQHRGPALIERILEHLGGGKELIDPADRSGAPPPGRWPI